MVRTVRTLGSDGPRLVQIVQPCWLGCLPYLQGAAQVLFYFLFLWSFAFPQRPLVSISFVVAGTVNPHAISLTPWTPSSVASSSPFSGPQQNRGESAAVDSALSRSTLATNFGYSYKAMPCTSSRIGPRVPF